MNRCRDCLRADRGRRAAGRQHGRQRVRSGADAAAPEGVQRARRQHRHHPGLQGCAGRGIRHRRCRKGNNSHDRDDLPGRFDQQAGGRDGVAQGRPGWSIHARSGRQHDIAIVESARRPLHPRPARHAEDADEPYVRHGRRLRISRLRPGRAVADDPADPGREAPLEPEGRAAGARAAQRLRVPRAAPCSSSNWPWRMS